MTSLKDTLAVALHYDKGKGAPRVVAKGRGTIGAKIIEVAKEHDIPIEENEVLAGALSNVELGDEIPEGGRRSADFRDADVGPDPLTIRRGSATIVAL